MGKAIHISTVGPGIYFQEFRRFASHHLNFPSEKCTFINTLLLPGDKNGLDILMGKRKSILKSLCRQKESSWPRIKMGKSETLSASD